MNIQNLVDRMIQINMSYCVGNRESVVEALKDYKKQINTVIKSIEAEIEGDDLDE